MQIYSQKDVNKKALKGLVLKLADTALSLLEHLDDAEPGGVGERVEERHSAIKVGGTLRGHGHV